MSQGVRGIPQPNSTRWNSTLTSVKAVVRLNYTVFKDLCTEEKRQDCVFTATQWAVLEELVVLLEPFLDATNQLQADKVNKLLFSK